MCGRLVPLVGPASGHDLGAGVERHALGAVDVMIAEQRVLPAAEAVEGHRHGDRHVDADHADLDAALELAGCLAGVGEDRGPVGVGVGVDERDRIVERRNPHHAQQRPEDLVAVDLHVGGDVVEQRRPDPESVAAQGVLATVDDDVGGGALDVADDPVACGRGDDRTHLGVGLEAGTDADRERLRAQALDELVAGVADRDGDADGHAALAGGPVAGGDEVVGGEVEIGVGHHDRVVLGPAQSLHALAGRRGALVNVLGDRGRADERDRRDVRMVEQRVNRDLVPVHDVEDAVGQSRFGVELGDQIGHARVALGGLEHERVPRRDRDRVHPHRDHDREVERRDPGAHAQRLAERVQVDPGRDLLGEFALGELRDPASELDDLHAAHDFAARVVERLAVLGGDDPRELVGVLVDQLAELEHHARAPGHGHVAPLRERRLGRLDGRVDVGGLGEQHLSLLAAGGRVVDGRGAARAAGRSGAAYAVRNGFELNGAHGVLTVSGVFRKVRCVALWRS